PALRPPSRTRRRETGTRMQAREPAGGRPGALGRAPRRRRGSEDPERTVEVLSGSRGTGPRDPGTACTESCRRPRLSGQRDQARRARGNRRGVEVSPGGLDGEPSALEERDQLAARVGAHALAKDLGRSGAPPLDLLLQPRRLRAPPAADAVLPVAAGAALFGHEARQRSVAIEGVAEEGAAGSEHPLDFGNHRQILALPQKVAEAGEEVDHGPEAAVSKRQGAHGPG